MIMTDKHCKHCKHWRRHHYNAQSGECLELPRHSAQDVVSISGIAVSFSEDFPPDFITGEDFHCGLWGMSFNAVTRSLPDNQVWVTAHGTRLPLSWIVDVGDVVDKNGNTGWFAFLIKMRSPFTGEILVRAIAPCEREDAER